MEPTKSVVEPGASGPATASAASSIPTADEIVALARRWSTDAASVAPSGSAALLARILEDEAGLDFTLRFIDRVVRPEDLRVAARELSRLADPAPAFLPPLLRFLVRLGGMVAPILPWPVVPIARRVVRRMVGHLLVDATPASFGRAMRRIRRPGIQLNVNLLGEAVLGDQEAGRRFDGTFALLRRPDVDYVSIKVSAVVSNLNMWAFDETVDKVVDRLTPLYEFAATETAAGRPKFINLDMEEYRDLDLTIAVFTKLLSQPTLTGYRGGIVLQAYLPDAVAALDSLTEWATTRVAAGGSPVKVRVVKGANLAMERVDAELHGWPLATWGSKAETDANYKRMLLRALTPERLAVLGIGAAGQNVFDIAFTHLLATARGVRELVDTEMLLGMAESLQAEVSGEVGGLILYTPVVRPSEFDVAISYLIRRLEENAASENFMSALFRLDGEGGLFSREEDRFRTALAMVLADADGFVPAPHRVQNREVDAAVPFGPGEFDNVADTDTAIAANRAWGRAILERARTSSLGAATVAFGRVEDRPALEQVLSRAAGAASGWAGLGAERRAELLRAAGASIQRHRADLVEVMVADGVKTIDQADVEVSEAADFANYYALGAIETERMPGVRFRPVGVTVVVPPWNFPVAIPAGGVLAALAAGSSVVIKPAPQVKRCAAVMVEALWEAGVPRDVLQFVDVDEGPLGKALITDARVGKVVLTGSIDTATLFRSWDADLPLIAETSGKDAIVVTPSADLDLAVADLVKSAFGHQGQKCSAASLGILVGSVATSERFRRQLVDFASSLVVGEPWEITTQFGPLVEPAAGKLLDALTVLQPGERWLLEPKRLDESGRRWTPGIKIGVAPGSPFHTTEVFGPVLGLMVAKDLDEAIALQNGTPYGLTAGLHSLDEGEIAAWSAQVEAGNLYVNRGITGAIVRRQPFGGWKESVVGSTAKAGGPNYVFEFGEWIAEPGDVWDADLSAAARFTKVAKLTADRDPSALAVESNVFRYRHGAATLRIGAKDAADDARRELEVVRTVYQDGWYGIEVSVDPAHKQLATALGRARVRVESDADFRRRLVASTPRPSRVRILSATAGSDLAASLGGDPRVTIVAGRPLPPLRLAVLPYLREQAVSTTRHRFGNPIRHG